MQSERENYIGNISKEHKGKITGGLRKESEPNPASVQGTQTQHGRCEVEE